MNNIQTFNSINNNAKNYGGFKRSKNHCLTNLFYLFRGSPLKNLNQLNENKNNI